jgi:putative transposase
MEGPIELPLDCDSVVGIDLGLCTLATLSDGSSVANPRFARRADRALRRAHRVLSRKGRGSANRRKARRRLARRYQRVANQRQDLVHQLTTAWVRRYAGVCVEDLSVKGLSRTRLARSVLDAAFGSIRRTLEWKCNRHRVYFRAVDRFAPTTKTCSACLAPAPELALGDRTWACRGCGVVHDRDLNASRNIKRLGYESFRSFESQHQIAAGHTEIENARGGSVSPPDRVATAIEARIPAQ